MANHHGEGTPKRRSSSAVEWVWFQPGAVHRHAGVVAGNVYKGRAVDVKQVSRELGIRYVLEGSLWKAGNRIRFTAQLVEAETGVHFWAERYDRSLADIFALQDEITEAVTTAIAPVIADAERRMAMRRPPNSLDAWGAYQRGLWHFGRFTAEDNTVAQRFFRQAIELDESFSGGYAGLALAQIEAVSLQLLGFFELLSSAETLARRAVALDNGNAEARSYLCNALWMRGDYEGALAEAKRVLAMSPNLGPGSQDSYGRRADLRRSPAEWTGNAVSSPCRAPRGARRPPRSTAGFVTAAPTGVGNLIENCWRVRAGNIPSTMTGNLVGISHLGLEGSRRLPDRVVKGA
jgi:tetratricopeptide (TPR) repeat protein